MISCASRWIPINCVCCLQRSVFVSELEHEYHQLQGESRPDMFEGMLGERRQDAGGVHDHRQGCEVERPGPDSR